MALRALEQCVQTGLGGGCGCDEWEGPSSMLLLLRRVRAATATLRRCPAVAAALASDFAAASCLLPKPPRMPQVATNLEEEEEEAAVRIRLPPASQLENVRYQHECMLLGPPAVPLAAGPG